MYTKTDDTHWLEKLVMENKQEELAQKGKDIYNFHSTQDQFVQTPNLEEFILLGFYSINNQQKNNPHIQKAFPREEYARNIYNLLVDLYTSYQNININAKYFTGIQGNLAVKGNPVPALILGVDETPVQLVDDTKVGKVQVHALISDYDLQRMKPTTYHISNYVGQDRR
jgi:hypothetical protein